MKKVALLFAVSLATTALMAQQKADTIQVSSLDSIATEQFNLPDNFQGDTAYNHVFRAPEGTMHVSGFYHVGPAFGEFPGMPQIHFQVGPAPQHPHPQLTKKQQKAREKALQKRAKAEKKRRIKAIRDAYKYGY